MESDNLEEKIQNAEKIKKINDERLNIIKDLAHLYNNAHFGFYRTMLGTSTALIGIIIGLKPDSFDSIFVKWCFVFVISFYGVNLFASTLVLLAERAIYKKGIDTASNEIYNSLNSNKVGSRYIAPPIAEGKVITSMSKLSLYTFALAALALIIYSFSTIYLTPILIKV